MASLGQDQADSAYNGQHHANIEEGRQQHQRQADQDQIPQTNVHQAVHQVTFTRQHVNLDAHTDEQVDAAQNEGKNHNGHWVIERVEHRRDGYGHAEPAFRHLSDQVAEIAAEHGAPEDGGDAA